jgi:hypothetical protein
MDFGKYLFEQNKKNQSAKRKQKQVHVESHLEIQRPGDGAQGTRCTAPCAGQR